MKTPRLFYYEEAVEAWIPVPDLIENIIDLNTLSTDEKIEIRFKRVEMTDEEFESLPED